MTICKVLWCGRLEVCGKSLSESQAFFHYNCHVKQRSAGAGAVWDLSDLVPRAKANKANCQQLSSYTQDMLRIFELKGQAPSSLPPPPKCPLEWLRPQQGLASRSGQAACLGLSGLQTQQALPSPLAPLLCLHPQQLLLSEDQRKTLIRPEVCTSAGCPFSSCLQKALHCIFLNAPTAKGNPLQAESPSKRWP